MSKTIIVCGYGPGISDAVARKFGAEGFSVALVARSAQKLQTAVDKLAAQGVKAQAFATDLGDANAVQELIGKVQQSLGPITVIHWNAYAGRAGDLLTASAEDLRTTFDVSVTGLVAAVQASHSDLKSSGHGAVLVTGGGFAFYDPQVDAMATQWNAMGLAVAKAAQHKLTGLLSTKLSKDGIYVGEVIVMGIVKGTAFDSGYGQLEPDGIAATFFQLYTERKTTSVKYPG